MRAVMVAMVGLMALVATPSASAQPPAGAAPAIRSIAIASPRDRARNRVGPGWRYVNPLRRVTNLQPSRIDMGVDYSGAGPILAIGRAKVVLASDKLAGPESCWGKTCVPPPGDMIVYRLLDGPFAGKYVYVVEHITIAVKTGEMVRAGQQIATLHEGSPNLEIGWAAGNGAYTLAAARGQQFPGSDPGGWSSIEGRNFDQLLVWLGAPPGYVTTAPAQRMPAGWPALPSMP